MNKPTVKIIAVSNVYCRLMQFEKAGDVELGHYHTHDHGTLISSGEVKVEILSDVDLEAVSTKTFTAPSFVFIAKDKRHRITALQDNTTAVCIHAIRDIDGTLLSPEFIIDEKQFNPNQPGVESFSQYVESKLGHRAELFAINNKPRD